MFEVEDLRYATLATVSRCGMVWFSEDVLSTEMIFENYLQRLREIPVEEGEEDMSWISRGKGTERKEDELSPTIQVGCPPATNWNCTQVKFAPLTNQPHWNLTFDFLQLRLLAKWNILLRKAKLFLTSTVIQHQ